MRISALILAGLAAAACSDGKQRRSMPEAKEQIAAMISAGTSALSPAESQFADRLGAFLQAKETEGFSGVILFTYGDKALLRQSYGVSGCEGDPINVDDVFDIGSLVKNYTRLAAYHLAAEGKLKLDDPISAYLPGVPEAKSAITIRMLVEHNAGLDDIVGEGGLSEEYSTDWDYLPVTKDQIIERGMQSTLIHAPGETRRYSNLGYSLLAAIIENASGASFESYVRESILTPFGMSKTGYVLPDWASARLVDGCDKGEILANPYAASRFMADGPGWNLRGNGGMLGTADDIFSWISALNRKDFLPEPAMSEYFDAVTGQSRRFKETAAAFAGRNGVFDVYYFWAADTDLRLIMLGNNSEHIVENYLDDIFPMMETLKESLQEENNGAKD